MPTDREARYQVVVDWSNDGAFTGTAEDVTSAVLVNPAPKIDVGRDQVRELTPPMIGAASWELNNRDQTYSAEYPGSPIYGLLLPGRACEVRATPGGTANYEADVAYDSDLVYNGDPVAIFTGLIDEPVQFPERAKRSVGISAYGSMLKLRTKASTQLYEGITTGTAIGHALDAAGWPADKRDIDTGQTTLLYWWLADEDVLEACIKLANSDGAGATFYEDGLGVIHFEDRVYRALTARSAMTQAIFFDRSIGTEGLYEEDVAYDSVVPYGESYGIHHISPLKYAPGFRDIVNSVSLDVTQRSVAGLAVIWTYGTTLALGAAETKTVIAKLSSAPAKAIVCVNATDVTTSAGSITGVSLNRTSGQIIEITLMAGAGGATVNLLRLRGTSCDVSATITVTNSVDTSASIDKYGAKPLPSSMTLLTDISANQAESLADAIVERYEEPLATVEMLIVNVDAAHLYEQMVRQVSDRITIVETHTGIDNDFWIERIGHAIEMGGKRHLTTFGCSKVALSVGDIYLWDDAASVYDTATWGA